MADALPATYNSNTNLSLGTIPQIEDPELYSALLDIHNAIEALLTSSDGSDAVFTEYLAKRRGFKTVTADYTVLSTDPALIRVDATAGDVTVTMPIVSSAPGYSYNIKRIDSTTNTVIMDGDAAELIDSHAGGVELDPQDDYDIKAHSTGWDIL